MDLNAKARKPFAELAVKSIPPKMIFKRALVHTASGIILAHNHPSGSLRPSQADIQLTKKLVAAGKVLEINENTVLISTEGSGKLRIEKSSLSPNPEDALANQKK